MSREQNLNALPRVSQSKQQPKPQIKLAGSRKRNAAQYNVSKQPKTDINLRLKTKPEMTAPSLLADSIQEACNGLLLGEPSAVEVLAHDECDGIFAHAVLADGAV